MGEVSEVSKVGGWMGGVNEGTAGGDERRKGSGGARSGAKEVTERARPYSLRFHTAVTHRLFLSSGSPPVSVLELCERRGDERRGQARASRSTRLVRWLSLRPASVRGIQSLEQFLE